MGFVCLLISSQIRYKEKLSIKYSILKPYRGLYQIYLKNVQEHTGLKTLFVTCTSGGMGDLYAQDQNDTTLNLRCTDNCNIY